MTHINIPHGINRKKSDMSRFIPMDAHTCVEIDEIDDNTGCIKKTHSAIVKIDRRTGRVKKHMVHNTR
jgi:hypothetical protein